MNQLVSATSLQIKSFYLNIVLAFHQSRLILNFHLTHPHPHHFHINVDTKIFLFILEINNHLDLRLLSLFFVNLQDLSRIFLLPFSFNQLLFYIHLLQVYPIRVVFLFLLEFKVYLIL